MDVSIKRILSGGTHRMNFENYTINVYDNKLELLRRESIMKKREKNKLILALIISTLLLINGFSSLVFISLIPNDNLTINRAAK